MIVNKLNPKDEARVIDVLTSYGLIPSFDGTLTEEMLNEAAAVTTVNRHKMNNALMRFGLRACWKCCEVKGLSAYSFLGQTTDGLHTICKDCISKGRKKRQPKKAEPDEIVLSDGTKVLIAGMSVRETKDGMVISVRDNEGIYNRENVHRIFSRYSDLIVLVEELIDLRDTMTNQGDLTVLTEIISKIGKIQVYLQSLDKE